MRFGNPPFRSWIGTVSKAGRGARHRASTVLHRAVAAAEAMESRWLLSASPRVLSIDRANPAAATTPSTSVTYAVTFSKPVTGVNAADFVPVFTGNVSSQPPLVVSGSGASYTVTVNGIAGNGTLGLNLVDDSTIRDAEGQPLQKDATFSFHAQQTFNVGANPAAIAVADLEGDGKPDLVVANRFAYTASLLRGNGDGTFQAQQTVGTVKQPVALAVADLDGDHKLDIVVSGDNYAGTVDILLGNGDVKGLNLIGSYLQSVAVADISGDGTPDLVVVERFENKVVVLVGNGDGTFQPEVRFGTDVRPVSVAVADLDGDGKQDMAVANYRYGTINLFLRNAINNIVSKGTIPTGSRPNAIIAADVNGDGKPDLITANFTTYTNTNPANVSVLLNNGNGTFQQEHRFNTGFSSTALAAGDLNGDGKIDLAVANQNGDTISVLPGNGDGTFQTQQPFAAPTGPSGIAVADLNGDGRPDMVTSGSLSYTAGVLLNTSNGDFTGQVYTIVPGVNSINRTTSFAPDTTPSSVVFTVTFNAPAVGVDSSDFALQTTGTVNAGNTLLVSGSGAVYTVTVNGISGVGTLGLNLVDDDSITASGIPIGGIGASNGNFTGQVYTLAPFVQSITRATPASTSTAASSVTYTLTFNAPVTGVDAADFVLAPTGSATAATPVVVSGSGATYSLTVNGISGVGTLGVNLVDDDSIVSSGIPLGGAGANNGGFSAGQAFTILPAVRSINRTTPPGPNTSAASVTYTVTFSSPVTGVNAADFALALSGLTATPPLVVSGSGAVYTVTVNGISGFGTLGLNLVDDDSIIASGVALGGTGAGNGNFTGQVYTFVPLALSINRTIPPDSNTTASTVAYTVTFSAPVTGVDAADFTLALSGVTATPPLVVTGSGAVYTVTINGISGAGTLGLNLSDDDSIVSTGVPLGGAGSGNGAFTGQVYTFVPLVQSITRTTPPGPNATAGSVTYAVTFNAPVSGVDAGDFALALSGVTATTPVVVSGSGAAYSVTINGISGAGTLGLNLIDDDSIVSSGVPLAGSGTSNGNLTGEVFTFLPVVQSITRTSPATQNTSASSVTYTVTFSAPVTGVDATDFALALSGVTATTPVVVTGSGAVYSITVNGIAGDGTLGLNLVDDDSITASGLALAGAGAGNGNFTGDTYRISPLAIESLHFSANPVFRGNKVTVTASANAFGAGAASVKFFIDTNHNGAFNKGDKLLGTDAAAANGFSLTFLIDKKAAVGPLTVSAIATGKNKASVGPVVSSAVTVANTPPQLKKIVVAPPRPLAAKPFTLSINGATDKDGTIARVEFFQDTNHNGVLDEGADLLIGSSATKPAGFKLKIAPGTFSAGPITFFARVTDNNGGISNVAAATLTLA